MSTPACPYCFNRLNGSSVAFRCINPDQARCAPEFDAKLAEYRGELPLLQPRTFTVSVPKLRRMPNVAPCSCGYVTWKRICPECHNALPSEFGSLENLTFGLIGAKEAGKSNYIGVLIDRLAREVSTSFGGSLNALDDLTTKRYREDFRRYLFTDRQVVPITTTGGANSSSRYPLNYSFSLRRPKYLPGRKAVSLSLFDTAGENLDEDDTTTTHARYVAKGDGLIFVLDPLQLEGVRQAVSPGTPLPSVRTRPKEIIDRAIRILRKSHPSSRKIPIPVAVVFSKIDAVLNLVEPDSPLHHHATHAGYYDDADGEAIHQSIRAYLARWGADDIDNTLHDQFARYRYFGISSFGYAPTDQKLLKGVAPFRVEDPFLWLLSEKGFISKAKSGRTR